MKNYLLLFLLIVGLSACDKEPIESVPISPRLEESFRQEIPHNVTFSQGSLLHGDELLYWYNTPDYKSIISAFDINEKESTWELDSRGGSVFSQLKVEGDYLFFGHYDEIFRIFDLKNKEIIYQDELSIFAETSLLGTPYYYDNSVYLTRANREIDYYRVERFNLETRHSELVQEWNTDASDHAHGSPPAVGRVDGKLAIFEMFEWFRHDEDNEHYSALCIRSSNEDGTVNWIDTLNHTDGKSHSRSLLLSSSKCLALYEDDLHCLDQRTGQWQWSRKLESPFTSSEIFKRDDHYYILEEAGLRKFDPDTGILFWSYDDFFPNGEKFELVDNYLVFIDHGIPVFLNNDTGLPMEYGNPADQRYNFSKFGYHAPSDQFIAVGGNEIIGVKLIE